MFLKTWVIFIFTYVISVVPSLADIRTEFSRMDKANVNSLSRLAANSTLVDFLLEAFEIIEYQ